MAESKFLKYQDPSGDGLIDVCDVYTEVPEPACEDCKCIANGAAITPNWRQLGDGEAFLNEKNCMYQVVVETKYTTTLDNDGSDILSERYEEYADQATEALLDAFNKDTGAATLRTVKDTLEYTDYELPARPNSRLSLLYSTLYKTLCDIEDAEDEDEDAEDEEAEDEEEGASGAIEVTYTIQDLKSKLLSIRQGLHLYAAYMKPWRFIEGGNLFFQDGPQAGAVFNLSDYGDWGVGGGSITAKILPQLDKFLNSKGKNIRGVAGGNFKSMFGDTVVKVTFKFNGKYELKKLIVYTVECGEKPITYAKKLKTLKNKSAWKDSTAMAYLAQLSEMEADLTAREPVPWLEFVKKYTYPTIYSSLNQGYANTDPEDSAASCIAEALESEAKQLAQNAFDASFSLGDALAYKFQDNLCRKTIDETIDDKTKLGIMWDPNTDATKSIKQMAAEQAFFTLEQDDAVFDNFCAQVLTDSFGGIDGLEEFMDGFSKIKLCGLNDVMIDAIGCLFGGFSLEETLSVLTKSALQAMSLENFGNLFVGLPAEKQAELDALVKKKFENGEFFKESSTAQQTSDVLAGKLDYTKPWEDKELVEAQNSEGMKEGPTGETPVPVTPIEEPTDASRRTLVKQLDFGSAAKKQLSPDNVFEAYILALLEVYSDSYFELMEELNKFPGAQVIAGLIATVDCPKPPLIEPSVFDWIKDKELPFCRNANPGPRLPPMINPFEWQPRLIDISGAFQVAAKFAIQQALFQVLMKLMIKICEVIGGAGCSMYKLGGDLASSVPDASDINAITDIISQSICGENTSSEQIDNTIVNMFADLGLGAAALSDTEQVTNLAGDISAMVTRAELSNAFLGDPSAEFTKSVVTLVKFEYPEFEAALGSEEAIGSFFGNMGNLMPAKFRDQLADFAAGLPADDMLPANPSLCATTEQIEDFCAARSDILEGRATEDQIAKLCERPIDDLGDLVNALQSGPTPDLPPLFSDPGCDNGLIPYETDEAAAVATSALTGMLEQLRVDFATDMLGNGPGEGNWGLLNMILSDTTGQPFTAHTRKVSNRRRYVDFYIDPGIDLTLDLKDLLNPLGLLAKLLPDPALVPEQRGAFPYKVAAWLEDYMQTELTADFSSGNSVQDEKKYTKSFEDAGITTFAGGMDLLKLPNLGYNTEVRADFSNEKVVYLEKIRKEDPDLTLSYKDNTKGLSDVDGMFNYGFEIGFYLSDILFGPPAQEGVGTRRGTVRDDIATIHNRFDDNARIKITGKYNAKGDLKTELASLVPKLPLTTYNTVIGILKPNNEEVIEITESKFEFLATDDTFDDVDLTPYPKFLSTFNNYQRYLPQIVLLKEMIKEAGQSIAADNIKSSHDEIMSSITENFIGLIADNEDAFLYGAAYDDLSFDDVEYVVDSGQTNSPGGTNYYEAEVTDDDGSTRLIKNDDQIMGISRMQYNDEDNNRVIYLDPNTFGGSYMNPPLYIKPLENKGWLGFIDVMFPDLSPCKPYKTDLIDFESIQQKVENSYPTIPVDERLKSDPDCIVETPYARILDRSAAAGLESIISAAIRIYVSTFFIKSMATFTKFNPKFPDVFSNIYAAYIVEEMESSLRDAQKAGWEMFNPFKDTEFWYAFLEQSVQLYSRRVDNGEISDPPSSVVEALVRLNDKQEKFHYPYKKDMKRARQDGDAGTFETLKSHRKEKNLEAVQATEEDAKMVLKELVVEQLNIMGEKFIENLKIVGMAPTIYDIDYYLLQDLSQGGENLTLDQEIKEEFSNLPTEGEGHYTTGREFALPDGTKYVGYYHVNTVDGNPVYMVGEAHSDTIEHDTLTPMANKIIVPIGDITEYGSVDIDTSDTSKPFVIEKYISIDGAQYSPTDAISKIIAAGSTGQNISDIYPGTLELVTDNNGQIVGLEGELGVRHGLSFSVIINGTQVHITDVEVDALDVVYSQVDPLEGDSKLLLCLINKLKEDDKFKLVAQYIFPLKKIAATLAIYNGLAFLPSIGEKVAEDGDTVGSDSSLDTKPGVAVSFDEDTGVATVSASGEEGAWASKLDRDPGPFGSLFVREWDSWDQELLRNSKSRIKKIFKSYYNSRTFDPGAPDDSSDSPGTIITSEFKQRFKVKAGQNLLPWWKKRMLRTNPFNANDEMCEEKD